MRKVDAIKKKQKAEQKPAAGKPEKAVTPAAPEDSDDDDDDSSDEEEMNLQLSQFSRTFQKVNYENAMKIYGALKKQGKDPKVAVTTYELYDKAFPFEKVRRYDLVQQHMNMIEHFQDNLNENFTNQQNVDQFIAVGLAARAAINAKYHDGEFADPGNVDPWNPADPTWATVKF